MRKPESEETQTGGAREGDGNKVGDGALARPRMGNQEEVVTKTEGASGELRTEEYFFSKAVGGVLFALVNSSVLPQ